MKNLHRREERGGGGSFLLLVPFVLILGVLFLAGEVLAGQAVLYKAPRPMKDLLHAEQESAKTPAKGSGQMAYFYNPVGKTDPFKSFIAAPEEMGGKKQAKPRTYLETLDLSQLQLIAVVLGPKGRYAMVREPKGLGHVIKKGTAIGRNGGVVESITESGVTIREEYRDFMGRIKHKEIKKTLSPGK